MFCCIDFFYFSMNGESDVVGYSSEEDSRYFSQMVFILILGLFVLFEDFNYNNSIRLSILLRFSFEVCFSCVKVVLVYLIVLVKFVYSIMV